MLPGKDQKMAELKQNKNSDKRIATNHRWEAKNREKLSCIAPLGTKEAIQASGYTINAFICEAIQEKLDNL